MALPKLEQPDAFLIYVYTNHKAVKASGMTGRPLTLAVPQIYFHINKTNLEINGFG
jgi:hypothetical protein